MRYEPLHKGADCRCCLGGARAIRAESHGTYVNQFSRGREALLALSAGALIYVGASHLLPTAEREPRRYNLLALGAGILVALGIIAMHIGE